MIRSLAASLLMLWAAQSQALVMTATPLESKEEAEALYQPIADMLSEALDQEVIFEYSTDWFTFSKKIIASDYDIILSEPHIVAYITSNTSVLSMKTVAQLPGELRYHIVVKQDDEIGSINDLQSQRICMLPSPNFSGVMIMKEFVHNPVTQPLVVEVRGTYENVYDKFRRGHCRAAIIDEATYQQISRIDDSLRSIYQTDPSPNMGVAISERIPHADRVTIQDLLINTDNMQNAQALFDRYSKGKLPFDLSSDPDFESFNVLPGVVWGW